MRESGCPVLESVYLLLSCVVSKHLYIYIPGSYLVISDTLIFIPEAPVSEICET